MVIKTASPGVIVNEVDLTRGTSDAITTNVGALAGPFKKGPVDKITLIEQEVDLIDTFGAPTDENYEYFYSVDNFLEYGGVCYVVRCDDSVGGAQTMRNAADGAKIDANGNEIVYYVKNEDDFEENFFNVEADMGGLPTKFLANNPGEWGNSLAVAVIDQGADYELTLYSDRAWALDGSMVTVQDEIFFDKNLSVGSTVGKTVKVAAAQEQLVTPPAFAAVKVASSQNVDLSLKIGKAAIISVTNGGSGYGTPNGTKQFDPDATGNNGSGSRFIITVADGVAQTGITMALGGADYQVGDTLTLTTAEQATILTVDTVDAAGAILTFTETQLGTGIMGDTGTVISGVTRVTGIGLGLTLNLDIVLTQVVNATIIDQGTSYVVGDTVNIDGGNNDAVVTIDGVADGETVDGISITEQDRILVKNQTNPAENGIYIVSAGDIVRASDADSGAEYVNGKTVEVQQGTNAGPFVYSGASNPTIGVDNLTFDDYTPITLIGHGDFVSSFNASGTVESSGKGFVQHVENGTYQIFVTEGSFVEGDTLSKDGGTNITGPITASNNQGEMILYSFGAKDELGQIIDEKLVNVIYVPHTYTYEEGLELGWPAPIGGKQRLPIDGDRAKTATGDTYVWLMTESAWVSQAKPTDGSYISDGTNIFEVDAADNWYDKQIAFQGIPWFRFAGRPSATLNARDKGARGDELHVIVYDATGDITGSKGNVIESFFGVSKLRGAKTPEGDNNYYVDVVNRKSVNIFANQDVDGPLLAQINQDFDLAAPGANIGEGVNCSYIDVKSYKMTGGVDNMSASLGELQVAYQKFIDENVEDLDYVLQGPSLHTEDDAVSKANFIISIAESKKSCMAFISPPKYAAVDPLKADIITERVVEFFDELSSSSYAVFDSGYKYTYDRFNDKQRYVPMNGDIAGLMTNSTLVAEPWYSPAGVVRGQIRNVTRLSYNPSKEQRDVLYSNRVNPIATFPGEGTILYGDKTALAYSSAFDRINVRKLFLIIEKEISKISRSVLFEFNDQTTRSMFKNNVNPYLRDIMARRGMTDFLVVCDESNNTPEVIDRNEFVADIYIKPNRSINFVTLNFIATKTGVTFSEAVGLFRR